MPACDWSSSIGGDGPVYYYCTIPFPDVFVHGLAPFSTPSSLSNMGEMLSDRQKIILHLTSNIKAF